MDIIFNRTHYDRDIIREQLDEWRFRGYAASLQNEDKETKKNNDGSKDFDMDLEPILI